MLNPEPKPELQADGKAAQKQKSNTLNNKQDSSLQEQLRREQARVAEENEDLEKESSQKCGSGFRGSDFP